MKSVLEEISRRLAQIATSGSFATRRTAAAGDLNLKVKDVGRIRLPVTASTARRLCEVARPARHGFKDETRLDRRVRDTWEIPKSRISIDEPRWMRTLTPQLDRIRRSLGLPEECRLKAQLHNMLVYAPDRPTSGLREDGRHDRHAGRELAFTVQRRRNGDRTP